MCIQLHKASLGCAEKGKSKHCTWPPKIKVWYIGYTLSTKSFGRKKFRTKKFRTSFDISDEKLSDCLFKGGKTFGQ